MTDKILDVALGIFADQLAPWTPQDLRRAVQSNLSLARELRVHKSTQLQLWQSMASPFKIMNRREYDRFLNGLTYQAVFSHVRKANPALARTIETTPKADTWLLAQIRECRQLFQ